MQAVMQFRRISGLLSHSAKRKALQAAPRLLWGARTHLNPRGWHQAAIDALKPDFPSASGHELDVVAFYLLARVTVALSDVLTAGGDLNDLDMLRLQQMMDRRSQVEFMLSNVLKECESVK